MTIPATIIKGPGVSWPTGLCGGSITTCLDPFGAVEGLFGAFAQCQSVVSGVAVNGVFRILDRAARRSQRGLVVCRCVYPEVAGNFLHALIFHRA